MFFAEDEVNDRVDDIVDWLLKEAGPPATRLVTVDDIEAFIEEDNVVVVGFFKDECTDLAKAFLGVASEIDDIPFGIGDDFLIYDFYGSQDEAIVLYKKDDTESVIYQGGADERKIKKFILTNYRTLLSEISTEGETNNSIFNENAQEIVDVSIPYHFVLFLNKSNEPYQEVTEAAFSVATQFREQVSLVIIDVCDVAQQKYLDFFSLKKSDAPTTRLLHSNTAIYKPPFMELTAKNLRRFVQDFLDGKLNLPAQNVPEKLDKIEAKVLVANDFNSVALDVNKDVLVEFYAGWCKLCEEFDPTYDMVAEYFKENDDIVIAKRDSTINELAVMKIEVYPTFKLFKKETNDIIDYTGPRTFEGLTRFIENGGKYPYLYLTVQREEPQKKETDFIVRDEL